MARKLRRCCARSSRISRSSVSPSTPQFQDRLCDSPSRLPSPLASLCFSLYETRSRSVNPSCAVTKLMLRDRAPAVVLVQVGRAGDPAGELAQRGRLAAPEVADGVPELAVPLGPLRREVADLVAAGADVPRLGDELHLADHRVLLDQVEERRQPVDVVELAGQRRGQVEPEAVDVHLDHPVAQRVHDQLQRVRVPHVEAVAGAGVVHVVLRLVVDQPVVGGVVDAREATASGPRWLPSAVWL